MANHQFNTGDVVHLKGSAQLMVVQRKEGAFGELGMEDFADGTPVHWIDKNGRPQIECYEAACLEAVGAPEAL